MLSVLEHAIHPVELTHVLFTCIACYCIHCTAPLPSNWHKLKLQTPRILTHARAALGRACMCAPSPTMFRIGFNHALIVHLPIAMSVLPLFRFHQRADKSSHSVNQVIKLLSVDKLERETLRAAYGWIDIKGYSRDSSPWFVSVPETLRSDAGGLLCRGGYVLSHPLARLRSARSMVRLKHHVLRGLAGL